MGRSRSTLLVAAVALIAVVLLVVWAAVHYFRYDHSNGDGVPFAGGKTNPGPSVTLPAGVHFEFPVIKGYGGVVPTPGAVDGPRKGSRLVFDVTAEAKEPGKVLPALERIALLLNLGGLAGVKPSDIRITAVLHGAAMTAALNDEAYATLGGRNPNAELLRLLTAEGVELLVCGQALARRGFEPKHVRGEVRVAVAALTVVANRQAEGFAYVPSH